MLISIIMPVYNNERYFPMAVKSVTEQNYEDFELLIVDDGSTDRTSVIADEIAATDERIRVIHQKNQWIYASLNRGIAEAKGEYIYIVNSDDRLRPGCLALMAQKAERYKPDVIWTKVLIHKCNENQNILVYDVAKWDEKVKEEIFYSDQKAVRDNWPYLFASFLVQNQANLYRSELMKNHKFRNDVYGADTLFNISIASEIESALVMKEPVYDYFVYSQTGMNVSTGKFYPYEHDMFNQVYGEYKTVFSQWKLSAESYRYVLVKRRIKQVTREIYSLFCANCEMSTEEKAAYILCTIPDDIVKKCASWGKCEEELESRILSGLRMLFCREHIKEDSEMYFAYELLDSLLRYEKDEDDYRKIESAIWNLKNPAHIGKVFYDQLKCVKEREK